MKFIVATSRLATDGPAATSRYEDNKIGKGNS